MIRQQIYANGLTKINWNDNLIDYYLSTCSMAILCFASRQPGYSSSAFL